MVWTKLTAELLGQMLVDLRLCNGVSPTPKDPQDFRITSYLDLESRQMQMGVLRCGG